MTTETIREIDKLKKQVRETEIERALSYEDTNKRSLEIVKSIILRAIKDEEDKGLAYSYIRDVIDNNIEIRISLKKLKDNN